MEAIFGGSQATGRYAMGSNEPLGTNMGQIDDETAFCGFAFTSFICAYDE
jgi:hypothetical protein